MLWRAPTSPEQVSGSNTGRGLSPPSNRSPLRWLLPLALLHGMLYLAIVPPWQHYDEPAHFEYAWLIARDGHLPAQVGGDAAMRREVADSMYRFRFYTNGAQPDLAGGAAPEVGINQRTHPPLYYAMAALPLRLTAGLSVEAQLYSVRLLSLGLYVLAVLTAWRISSAVLPDEPRMQIVIPLLLLFTPTFADIMTAINNDVLVNLSALAVLLGCVLLVRDGVRPVPLVLATLALGVALGTKRTAVILALPYALALFWGWRRSALTRPWRLWVGSIIVVLVGAVIYAVLSGAMVQIGRNPLVVALDRRYLRLNVSSWLASLFDIDAARGAYGQLWQRGFGTFWARFGWAHVRVGAWAEWAFGVLCACCGVGLLVQGWRARHALPLWQRRVLWMFVLVVTLGLLSMVGRIHPLTPSGLPTYVPVGRYIFTVMLPILWLLALGWQGILPRRWRPFGPLVLLALWCCFDLFVWGGTIVGFYYATR